MTDQTKPPPQEYRFVSKVLTTKWRAVPKNGLIKPSTLARMQMGEHYDLEIRDREPKRAAT